jgi:hypothetical protein
VSVRADRDTLGQRLAVAKRKGEDIGEHAEGFAPVADALRDAVRDQPWLAGETFCSLMAPLSRLVVV